MLGGDWWWLGVAVGVTSDCYELEPATWHMTWQHATLGLLNSEMKLIAPVF